VTGGGATARVSGGGEASAGSRAAALLTGSGPAAGWLLVTVLALAGAILTVIVWRELAASDALANLGGSFASVVYATLGALVLWRVGNRIGWILLGVGASFDHARRQIKWFALAGVTALASQLAALLATAASHGASSWLVTGSYAVMALLVMVGFPAAITVAILKHGLYAIDVIINRALVYGLLSATVTATYAGIVVGIGTLVGDRGGPVLTVAAAVAIAVLFQPVRHRAQLLANRVVYGERATPYQVLADFAQDMAGSLDFDVALDRMAAVLARAVGATRVGVWTRVGSQLRPRVNWPPGSAPPAAVSLANGTGLPALEATRAAAVRHGDELLGAITLDKPRNEPVSAAEDRLLQHLASQAGLVLRNVRLTDELKATINDLRASRRRLVQAQDSERQRLERNLHDGAKQQLIALAVQLRLLDDAAGDPGEIKS
jgi:signal transduction histidine kinase